MGIYGRQWEDGGKVSLAVSFPHPCTGESAREAHVPLLSANKRDCRPQPKHVRSGKETGCVGSIPKRADPALQAEAQGTIRGGARVYT